MRDEQVNILVIEDDQVLAEVTAFRLELLGYAVTSAHSVDEANRILSVQTPDLIIIDIALPGGDAFELINRIRCEAVTAEAPMMVFSSDGDLNAVQRAYHSGAREFLVTPFDPALLEAKVVGLLENAPTA